MKQIESDEIAFLLMDNETRGRVKERTTIQQTTNQQRKRLGKTNPLSLIGLSPETPGYKYGTPTKPGTSTQAVVSQRTIVSFSDWTSYCLVILSRTLVRQGLSSNSYTKKVLFLPCVNTWLC